MNVSAQPGVLTRTNARRSARLQARQNGGRNVRFVVDHAIPRPLGRHLKQGTRCHTPLWTLLTLVISVGVGALTLSSSRAQGTTPASIRFANLAPGVDAPFFRPDGFAPLSGSNFVAALYVAAANSNNFALVGSRQPFSVGTTAGYWAPITVAVPQFPAGSRVRVQVRFWDDSQVPNSNFAEAEARGADIGVAEIAALELNADGSPTPLFGLQSASLMPTLTLSQGGTRVAYDPATAARGGQLPVLCDVPVGTNRWFRLTSLADTRAMLTTDGSSIDTVMTAFRGSIVHLTALEPVACNDDRARGRTSSAFSLSLEANELYLVCIAGKHGASGPVQLHYAVGVALEIRTLPGRNLEIAWPADQGRFQLESAPHPDATEPWEVVAEFPFLIGNRYFMPMTATAPVRCFRLRALP